MKKLLFVLMLLCALIFTGCSCKTPELPEEPVEPETPVEPNEPEIEEPKEPEAEQVPEWVQPHAGNPYKTGDKVMFEGQVYVSLIDGNVWSPTAYPQGWQLV